jgi:hypothetical protein
MSSNAGIEIVTLAELRLLSAVVGCRTKGELAQLLGVTQSRISQILSGTLLTLVRSFPELAWQPLVGRSARRTFMP